MKKKGRTTRSMRGSKVDFDLMDIKSQMASAPKPTEVKSREDFIETRLNRRLKRKLEREKSLIEEQQQIEEKKKEEIEQKRTLSTSSLNVQTEEVKTKIEDDLKIEIKPKTRRIKKKISED